MQTLTVYSCKDPLECMTGSVCQKSYNHIVLCRNFAQKLKIFIRLLAMHLMTTFYVALHLCILRYYYFKPNS